MVATANVAFVLMSGNRWFSRHC